MLLQRCAKCQKGLPDQPEGPFANELERKDYLPGDSLPRITICDRSSTRHDHRHAVIGMVASVIDAAVGF